MNKSVLFLSTFALVLLQISLSSQSPFHRRHRQVEFPDDNAPQPVGDNTDVNVEDRFSLPWGRPRPNNRPGNNRFPGGNSQGPNWQNGNGGQGPNWQGGNNGQGPNWQGGNNGQGPNWQGGNNGQGPNWQNGNNGQGPNWQGGNQQGGGRPGTNGQGPNWQNGNNGQGPNWQGGNNGQGPNWQGGNNGQGPNGQGGNNGQGPNGQGGNQQQQQGTTPTPGVTTTAATATTLSPRVRECIQNCPGTPEYNPVCGSDRQNYTNRSRLECAIRCGVNARYVRMGNC